MQILSQVLPTSQTIPNFLPISLSLLNSSCLYFSSSPFRNRRPSAFQLSHLHLLFTLILPIFPFPFLQIILAHSYYHSSSLSSSYYVTYFSCLHIILPIPSSNSHIYHLDNSLDKLRVVRSNAIHITVFFCKTPCISSGHNYTEEM